MQAKDEAAKARYLRQAEFIAFPEDGRVLRLPVEVVVGAVGEITCPTGSAPMLYDRDACVQ
ncbi:hypothetical protein MCELHM10_01315 [Paracoccaceae bacterium]